MRRILTLAPMIVAGVLVAGSAWGSVILVPGNYPTIQGAIDHAVTSDIILVSPGVYMENIVIDVNGLSLIGSGKDVTTIYPAISDVGPAGPPVYGNSQVIVVEEDDIEIQGFTIDGDNPALPGGLGTLDARNGIVLNYTLGDWESLRMHDLVLQNFYMTGAYLRGASMARDLRVTGVICSQVNSVPQQSAGISFYNATGTVTTSSVSFCEIGIEYLSGSGGRSSDNTISDSAIGVLVWHNGSAVEIGALNNVINYASAGIEVNQAAAPVSIHDNLVSTTTAPGPGGSGGIAIFGQSAVWSGYHQINGNTLSGPTLASKSCGVWIDTFSGATVDVHAELKGNQIHFFDVGVYIVDSNGDPSAVHDVIIGADSLAPNRLGSNGSYIVELDDCDDGIPATWNDWGVYTPGDIEEEVWHLVDDPLLGLVTFVPFYPEASSIPPVGRGAQVTWGVAKNQFR